MARGSAGFNRMAAGLAAVALAAALLVPAAPAEAGWLGRGLGVAGAARSLKRNLGEAVDLLDDTLGAAIQGDFEEVERLSGELREVPGRIITDAFPVLSIGAGAIEKAEAVGEGLKTVRRRVGRFVGEAVTDARMALETGEYELETGVLDPKRPLPAVTLSGPAGTSRPAPSGSSAASTPDPWGQEPKEDEKAATGGADPWGQDPEDEDPVAGDVDPPGEEGQAEREGGDGATERLQGEYAAALDRFLGAEEGSSDYEATLSALLEREKELLAGVSGQEEQELAPDERRRVQACLQEREFNPGAADGVFGPRTRTAIRAWQASQGREESGRLDQSSARTLLKECEVAVADAETTTTMASVERKFEPKCNDIFDWKSYVPWAGKNEMCYLELVNKPGCYLGVQNYKVRPGLGLSRAVLSVALHHTLVEYDSQVLGLWGPHWSGGCSGGVPDGQGTVSYIDNLGRGIEAESTGQFVGGAPHGDWTFRFDSDWDHPGREFWNEHWRSRYSMKNGRIHGEVISRRGPSQCKRFDVVNGRIPEDWERC